MDKCLHKGTGAIRIHTMRLCSYLHGGRRRCNDGAGRRPRAMGKARRRRTQRDKGVMIPRMHIFALSERTKQQCTTMTTITAEAFAMNVERYLKQAIKHGLWVITPEGHILLVEASEPLTANGMTEAEELALLKAVQEGEEDVKAGRVHAKRSTESVHEFMDRLIAD